MLNGLVKKAIGRLERLAKEALGNLAQRQAFFAAAGIIVGYLLGWNAIILWRAVIYAMDLSHLVSLGIECAIVVSLTVSGAIVGALIVAPRFR